ncbi:hypothetical protein ABIC17_002294 [Sphingomonas sp. PvP056]
MWRPDPAFVCALAEVDGRGVARAGVVLRGEGRGVVVALYPL